MILLERYAGNLAVLEIDGKLCEVPRAALVGEITEGTVLREENGRYLADPEATKTRRERLAGLQDSLFD